MKQLAIIPRDQRDIVQELEGCIERLQKSGIQVYATHRGQGYGVLWAEGSAFSTLTNAGFKAAPLTRTRSLKLGQRALQVATTTALTTVSEPDTEGVGNHRQMVRNPGNKQ
jgi:hypothetical protein